nr:omptin family outer membrane protease [Bradyrhizobium sp. 195]
MHGANYKVGGFIGWTYYAQNPDTMGCMQIANPIVSCSASADQIVGSQDTQWNAPRVGLSAETMLTEHWRLSTDVAYLPWTDFAGRDHHLLRPRTTFFDQRGNGGGGVQVEGVLSYFITNNLSIGVGGRYWAMWTQKDSETICTGCSHPGTTATQFSKFSMERWGTFFQASYKVN